MLSKNSTEDIKLILFAEHIKLWKTAMSLWLIADWLRFSQHLTTVESLTTTPLSLTLMNHYAALSISWSQLKGKHWRNYRNRVPQMVDPNSSRRIISTEWTAKNIIHDLENMTKLRILHSELYVFRLIPWLLSDINGKFKNIGIYIGIKNPQNLLIKSMSSSLIIQKSGPLF